MLNVAENPPRGENPVRRMQFSTPKYRRPRGPASTFFIFETQPSELTSIEVNVTIVTMSSALRAGDQSGALEAGPRELHTGKTLHVSWSRGSWEAERMLRYTSLLSAAATHLIVSLLVPGRGREVSSSLLLLAELQKSEEQNRV
jgi:hypothetical protein